MIAWDAARAALAGAVVCAAPASAQTAYFAEIPDLPLPPGFTQSGPATSFESEQGRVIMAEASGAGDMLAVRDFYYETLPQLGWGVSAEEGAVVFLRGRERLGFTIQRDEGRIRLAAQLAIQPTPVD